MKKIAPGSLVKLYPKDHRLPKGFLEMDGYHSIYISMYSSKYPGFWRYHCYDVPLLYLGSKEHTEIRADFIHYNFLWIDEIFFMPVVKSYEYENILERAFEKIS